MRDAFMLLAEEFKVCHGALRFVIFAGEHGDVGFEGVAFSLQAKILPFEGPDRFGYFFYFSFKLFGFAHIVIILLDTGWPQERTIRQESRGRYRPLGWDN